MNIKKYLNKEEINIEDNKISTLLDILSLISLLVFLLTVINNNFLWFSFTEGWYSTWSTLGSLKDIYDSGFPFPPIYLLIYKGLINISYFFSIDKYLFLRLFGIGLSSFNLFIIYRLLKNLGNKCNFSLLVACLSLITFNAMEALISYDYTPFNGLFVSLLALFIIDQDNNFYYKNFNYTSIIRPFLSAISVISLIGAKQSTLPIVFAFILIYLCTRKNRFETINFIFIFSFLLASYIGFIVNNIGYEGFINIYTNSEYKGGLEKIISRFPASFISSSLKLHTALIYSFIKGSIRFFVIFMISFFTLRKSFKFNKNHKSYKFRLFAFAMIILIITLIYPTVLSPLVLHIRSFRESGVALFLLSFIAIITSFGLLPKLKNELLYSHLLLLIFSGSIIITNILSGGTGAFDSFLVICIFASVVNNCLYYFQDYLTQDRDFISKVKIINRFKFLNKIIINLPKIIRIFLFSFITSISISTMIDIYKKGYQWWGISEYVESSFINDKISFFRSNSKTKQLPGSMFMKKDQRKYTLRVQNDFIKYKAKNVLSFPNIPYFYEALKVRPFANTPLSWVDVTGKKTSKKQITKWEQENPELIIYNLMNSIVYDNQGEAFSSTEGELHAFLYLNNQIIEKTKSGYYIVVDSYLSSDSGYGIFTLVRKDIFEKFNTLGNEKVSSEQKIIFSYLKKYYSSALQNKYLNLICFDHQKKNMEKFRRRLINENNIDCNNSGNGRVKILSTMNPMKKSNNIGIYDKDYNKISKDEEAFTFNLVKNNKNSNHILMFSYLLSNFGYE